MSRPIDSSDQSDLRVVHDRAGLQEALRAPSSRPRAVVMTMGALHEGHAALVRHARELVGPAGQVVVTIFVNPTQFGPTEDLERYPRTLDSDVDLCRASGADVVFAPATDVVYPDGDLVVTIDPGPLATQYEGVARPTHFRGVLSVVAKFLGFTTPDYAVFGEKDYQQLTLIRTMVRDLNIDVEVVGAPTVRDGDHLALSSRNKYLTAQAREVALRIPAAISAGQAAAVHGAAAVVAATEQTLTAPGAGVEITVEYVAVTDVLMGPAPIRGEGRLIVTAIVDGTRLLDNAAISLGMDSTATITDDLTGRA